VQGPLAIRHLLLFAKYGRSCLDVDGCGQIRVLVTEGWGAVAVSKDNITIKFATSIDFSFHEIFL
jgi:hypothetical protein